MAEFGDAYRRHFFLGETNRMVGSGGEVIIKGEDNRNEDRRRTIEPGDILIGIGITHLVESMERMPGPDSVNFAIGDQAKMAARAFMCREKEDLKGSFRFRFQPLEPRRYCDLLNELSHGSAEIDPDTVPPGTMILSFVAPSERYSLARSDAGRGSAWRNVLSGERHWNVGIASKDDFWAAEFPSDDVGVLGTMPAWEQHGRISFGLSLLAGSEGAMEMGKVQANHPEGRISEHDFHLQGQVSGTRGFDSDFYIGLRTQILCKPLA